MYVMIVTDNCPRCKASKQMLTEHNLSDKVEIVPISDPKGLQYARQYNLATAGSDIIDTDSKCKMSVASFISKMEGAPDA